MSQWQTKVLRIVGALGAAIALALAAPSRAAAAQTSVGPNGEVLLDDKPFVPIMQWLQSPSSIAAQKALGINTFVGDGSGGTAKAFLDTCTAESVVCAVDPSDSPLASHAALFGWIFGDEPDLESNQVEPSTLQAEYDALKQSDPSHVTLMTITAGFYSEMGLPAWMNGSDA